MGKTYITAFFETLLEEEYDRHIEDKDIDEWWGNFCRQDTQKDETPDWDDMCIEDYIEDFFDNTDAFDKLNKHLQAAIWSDIDISHLRQWINDQHETWYEEKMEKEANSTQTDPK